MTQDWLLARDCPCTLVFKPSFSQSLSLHRHLSLAQAHLLELTSRCLTVTGGGSVGEFGRSFGRTIIYLYSLTVELSSGPAAGIIELYTAPGC